MRSSGIAYCDLSEKGLATSDSQSGVTAPRELVEGAGDSILAGGEEGRAVVMPYWLSQSSSSAARTSSIIWRFQQLKCGLGSVRKQIKA